MNKRFGLFAARFHIAAVKALRQQGINLNARFETREAAQAAAEAATYALERAVLVTEDHEGLA